MLMPNARYVVTRVFTRLLTRQKNMLRHVKNNIKRPGKRSHSAATEKESDNELYCNQFKHRKKIFCIKCFGIIFSLYVLLFEEIKKKKGKGDASQKKGKQKKRNSRHHSLLRVTVWGNACQHRLSWPLTCLRRVYSRAFHNFTFFLISLLPRCFIVTPHDSRVGQIWPFFRFPSGTHFF